jgi:hypothetical protein
MEASEPSGGTEGELNQGDPVAQCIASRRPPARDTGPDQQHKPHPEGRFDTVGNPLEPMAIVFR